MGTQNTPPSSPGIPERADDGDQMYEEDVAEEINVGEGEVEGDLEEDEDEELVELPGGIDQLETLIEEHERPEDNSKMKFERHSGSVFCCDLSVGGDLAVTGGEDDKAFVWRVSDGVVEQEVAGWGDSVTCAAWSNDGGLIALADMSGAIRVLRCPGYEKVWSFEVGDVLWLQWHPVANVLFCGTEDSQMWMWKIPGGDSKVFTGAGERVECGQILGSGKKALCGYRDGSLRLFDLRSGETLHTMTGGHQDAINCITNHPERDLAVSGGMDGVAVMWNTVTGKNIGSLLCGEKQEENSADSIECVVIPDDKSTNLAVTGTLSGVVSVWDLSSHISRTSLKVGDGVTVMKLGSDHTVYCGTIDGAVRSMDIRTGNAVNEFTGHRGSVLDIQLNLEKELLLTAGDDGTSRIYDIRMT